MRTRRDLRTVLRQPGYAMVVPLRLAAQLFAMSRRVK